MSKRVAVRCPKCKGNSFTLYERLEVAHAFRVQNGEALVCEIADGLPQTIGFGANCDCGNAWVPRSKTAASIIEASEYRAPAPETRDDTRDGGV